MFLSPQKEGSLWPTENFHRHFDWTLQSSSVKIFQFRLHTDEFLSMYAGANWEATESVPISRLPHLIVKQRPYPLTILPSTSHPITPGDYNTGGVPLWQQSLEPSISFFTQEVRKEGSDRDTISLAKWAKIFDCLITLVQLFSLPHLSLTFVSNKRGQWPMPNGSLGSTHPQKSGSPNHQPQFWPHRTSEKILQGLAM